MIRRAVTVVVAVDVRDGLVGATAAGLLAEDPRDGRDYSENGSENDEGLQPFGLVLPPTVRPPGGAVL